MGDASKKDAKWKGYFLNFCTCCISAWRNDQGYPKYLTTNEVAEMLDGGATIRHVFCPDCRRGKNGKPNTFHSEK